MLFNFDIYYSLSNYYITFYSVSCIFYFLLRNWNFGLVNWIEYNILSIIGKQSLATKNYLIKVDVLNKVQKYILKKHFQTRKLTHIYDDLFDSFWYHSTLCVMYQPVVPLQLWKNKTFSPQHSPGTDLYSS